MSRLHEQYSNQIKDAMMKKFEYSNIMQVPKLEKIVINMGVGEAKENKKVLSWHLSLFILNIIGFIMCIARVYDNSIENYILSFVWTFSNIFYLFISIVFDLRYKRYDYKNFVPNKINKYSKLALIRREK